QVSRETFVERMRQLQVHLMRVINVIIRAIDVVPHRIQVAQAKGGLVALEVYSSARRDIETKSIVVKARGIAQRSWVRQIVVIVKTPQRRANAPWLLVYHRVLGKSRHNTRCTQSRQTSCREYSLHTLLLPI